MTVIQLKNYLRDLDSYYENYDVMYLDDEGYWMSINNIKINNKDQSIMLVNNNGYKYYRTNKMEKVNDTTE